MADWISDYNTYVNMTVAELKELLKSRDLPVSGKKQDLIQYLIFVDYPQFQVGGKFYDEISLGHPPRLGLGAWLEDKWRSNRFMIYATINYQTLKI